MRQKYINPESTGKLYLCDKVFETFEFDGEIYFMLNDLRNNFSTSSINTMVPDGSRVPVKLHFDNSRFAQRYMLVTGRGVLTVLARIRDRKYLDEFLKKVKLVRCEEDNFECDV